jgi:23S rRNA pseudouridine955/2504/2580 synthase
MSGLQTVTVEADEDDIRLDRWFKRRYPDLGHGQLQKLLRSGQVRVNGKRAKANARLEAGQEIRVPPAVLSKAPSAIVARPKQAPSQQDYRALEDIRARIIHQDDLVLAIDKPAGLAVQGGSGIKKHLDGMLDGLCLGAKERPRLVHRLDRDTSGVLLLARTAGAATALTRAFRARQTEKTYLAIVCGRPEIRRGRIDAPLSKGGPAGRERVSVDKKAGQQAVTDYQVLDAALKQASLLALRPLTGRTHQLRAHCLAIGNPILGDGKYGGSDAFLSGIDLPKQVHLHARRIILEHPAGGLLEVAAPLPSHFVTTMKALGLETGEAEEPIVWE